MSTNSEINDLKNRINRLESLVNKLLSAHQQFVSNLQVQELTGIIEINMSKLNSEISDVKNRLDILEELPDID